MAAPGFLTVDWLRVVTGVGSPMAAARAYVRFVEAGIDETGYAMKAVADFIGRHYVTVSRAVARSEGQIATPKMSECKT